MAKKIKVKVRSSVQAGRGNQAANGDQPNPIKIPIEANVAPIQARQGVGLKVPNMIFRAVIDPKKT